MEVDGGGFPCWEKQTKTVFDLIQRSNVHGCFTFLGLNAVLALQYGQLVLEKDRTQPCEPLQ